MLPKLPVDLESLSCNLPPGPGIPRLPLDLEGLTSLAKSKTLYSFVFKLFFSDLVFEQLANSTNAYALQKLSSSPAYEHQRS